MINRIFDLYSELEDRRVMLSFKGDLSTELITALLGVVERKMAILEPEAPIRKRVFNVAMECLQNLFQRNAGPAVSGGVTTSTLEPEGVIMILRNEMGYSVLTGNFMAGGHVEELKQRLDKVNTLQPGELRDLYKATLADGRYSTHGGGGLGIIDIARKSGQKLEYGFVPYNNDSAFFSLNVNVPQ